jgi:elongation factor P--(R)-beta-lysine ligase
MKTWEKLRLHPELWEQYFIREKVLIAIRKFFLDRKFHDVETPLITGSLPPESYLEVFETTLLSRERIPMQAFLPTSPEPFLKKLLVAGIGNCFSLTKAFRNTEDTSRTHNPEFTLLEWYRIHSEYTDLMKDCEELVQFIYTYLSRTKNNQGTTAKSDELIYQGNTVNISSPWERLTIVEAFKKYADINEEQLLHKRELSIAAKSKGYNVQQSDTWEVIFNLLFLNEVEPHLGKGRPTILYEFPIELAALARKKPNDPRFAERFEFYIEGLELGDAYGELTDWKEQQERFVKETEKRKKLGKTSHPTDIDFIDALQKGMPKSAGIAVGVDRLIMLFSDTRDIRDTLFFPSEELFSEN